LIVEIQDKKTNKIPYHFFTLPSKSSKAFSSPPSPPPHTHPEKPYYTPDGYCHQILLQALGDN
jgi:hypothetical protein